MHRIDYVCPDTVQDAAAVLAKAGSAARVLAGGTDLLIKLREHVFDDVSLVVDVKGIPELHRIAYDAESGLTIGAAVSCCEIYAHTAIVSGYPGLVDVASLIGGTQIQGRASFGGNLCNAAPSGDSIPIMIALGGIANIAGPDGDRRVPIEDFCTAPGQTVLKRGELLVSVHFPVPASRSGAHYLRFIPRNEMDIAVVGVGVAVTLNNSTVKSARVSLASVAPTPLLVTEAGDALVGKPPTEDSVRVAAELAMKAACPITDMRGTAEYRKHMCEVLTRRALLKAIERARESE